MTQSCLCCGEIKPLSSFEKQKNRPSHRRTCKQCRYSQRDLEKEKLRHRAYQKERRKLFPEKVRKSYERSLYGISKEEFSYSECVICGSTEKLHIDHNHSTQQVRGLLCASCNLGLGHFKDSTFLLEKASQYLKDGPHFQLPWKEYP